MSQSIELDSFALIHSRNKSNEEKGGKDMSGAGKIQQNNEKLA